MHPKAGNPFRLPKVLRAARDFLAPSSAGLVLFVSVALGPKAAAQNLANASFETTSGGFPVSWTKPYAKGYESFNTNTSRIYTGAGSVKIDDTGTAAGDVGAVRSAAVPINPGKKYIASIKCWLASGTTVSYYLEYRNAAGSILDASGNVVSGSPFVVTNTVTGSWQTMTVIPEDATTKQVLVAPPGATNLTVMAYSPVAQQGISYWDSASVIEVENVTVANYSFETLDGSSFPTNWTKPYSNGYESSSTTQHYVGSRSLKINDTSGMAGGVGGARSDAIPVIPGRKYMANIKCYLSSGTTAEFYLDYWNAAGTKMLTYSSSMTGTGAWKNITVIPEETVTNAQIVAPYGASYLTVMAYSPVAQNGISYFDAAQVLVDNIDFATAGVIAANPGFESVDGASFPLEWSKYGTMGYESGSTTTVFEGSRSVRINDTSASEVGGVESKKFPVIEGKSYTATAKCYVASGASPQFRVYVRYFDNEADLTPNSYTPDEYLDATYVQATQTGTWETLTLNFTPPFLAKYATILLYSSSAGVGDGYFDAVTVVAKANGLSNGSFEDWSLSGYPHSWTSYLNSANVVTSASTTHFSDIARSLKISDSSASEGGGARSNRITSVTVGQAYTATAQYYLESGSLDFYIEFWNSSDSRISESHGTVSTTGSWQTISVTGTAPSGTTYATVLIYSSTAGTCVGYADAVRFESDVVAATTRRQLFIDDFLVKTLTNVTKTVNQGTITNGGNPLITHDASKAWETSQLLCYGSFLYDAAASKYKLYYTTNGLTNYAESTDGETGWTKPNLGLFSYGGSTANNIVLDQAANPDEGDVGLAIVKNPSGSGFKAFGKWHYITQETSRAAWYKVFTSTDGKTFTSPTDTVNGWDVATMAYDATNSKYVGSVKYYDNVRRVHRMTTSTDGISWTVPIRNESLADTVDTQGHLESDSYGLGWYPYEGVYIGFDWVFQIDSGLDLQPGHQVGLITPQLVFSRDLAEAWYRPTRTALIPRGASGTWNDGVFYTASYAVTKTDKVLLYFSASDEPHYSQVPGTASSIGLATWRLDGFVSLNAGATEGTVLTKKLTFSGSSLKLNVDSSGTGNYAQVELLDSTGAVISGFAKANSDVINTDNVNVTATWGGSSNLASLAGQTIQVKVYLKNAKLYALQFQ